MHASLVRGHTRTWLERYQTELRDEQQAAQIRFAIEDQRARYVAAAQTRAEKTRALAWTPEWLVYDQSMHGSRKEMGLAKSIIEVYHDVLKGPWTNPEDDRRREPLHVMLQPGAAGRPAPEEARAFATLGGLSRMEALTSEARSRSARIAARHRWAKRGRLRCDIPRAKGQPADMVSFLRDAL